MLNFEIVSKRFNELRNANGFTQSQMAEYLQVDQSNISKCEKNERQFSIDILEKAANLFGCSIEYFTNDDYKFAPIPIAFRAKGLMTEDLETIAAMNKIALNLRYMDDLIKEG